MLLGFANGRSHISLAKPVESEMDQMWSSPGYQQHRGGLAHPPFIFRGSKCSCAGGQSVGNALNLSETFGIGVGSQVVAETCCDFNPRSKAHSQHPFIEAACCTPSTSVKNDGTKDMAWSKVESVDMCRLSTPYTGHFGEFWILHWIFVSAPATNMLGISSNHTVNVMKQLQWMAGVGGTGH
jgi:hypothetical protein